MLPSVAPTSVDPSLYSIKHTVLNKICIKQNGYSEMPLEYFVKRLARLYYYTQFGRQVQFSPLLLPLSSVLATNKNVQIKIKILPLLQMLSILNGANILW